MNWLNMEVKTRTAPEFIGSDPTQRATWLCLMLYCAEHENGGIIEGCQDWGDRRWMQTCGVTKAEVLTDSDLWEMEECSLVLWGYPEEKEAEVQAKRKGGKKGGKRSGQARKKQQETGLEKPINEASEEPQVKPELEAELERKGKEGNGKGKEISRDTGYGAGHGKKLSSDGKNCLILHKPEHAVKVKLEIYDDFCKADITSIACTLTGEFSGPGMGYFSKQLKALATRKGMDDEKACEEFRDMLFYFWSDLKAGEGVENAGKVINSRVNAIMNKHGGISK